MMLLNVKFSKDLGRLTLEEINNGIIKLASEVIIPGKSLPEKGKSLPEKGKSLPEKGKSLPEKGKSLPDFPFLPPDEEVNIKNKLSCSDEMISKLPSKKLWKFDQDYIRFFELIRLSGNIYANEIGGMTMWFLLKPLCINLPKECKKWYFEALERLKSNPLSFPKSNFPRDVWGKSICFLWCCRHNFIYPRK